MPNRDITSAGTSKRHISSCGAPEPSVTTIRVLGRNTGARNQKPSGWEQTGLRGLTARNSTVRHKLHNHMTFKMASSGMCLFRNVPGCFHWGFSRFDPVHRADASHPMPEWSVHMPLSALVHVPGSEVKRAGRRAPTRAALRWNGQGIILPSAFGGAVQVTSC